MIWVVGGTSESRDFLDLFHDRDKIVVSVATEDGKRFLKGARVVSGRMDLEGMVHFIRENRIRAIADLSHPYAVEVSRNAAKAARIEKISYLRYERSKTETFQDCIYVYGLEKCINLVEKLHGTIFFTTGVKNLPAFEKIRRDGRFVHRIIPSEESLGICLENKVEMKDIVALLGPFSREFNRSMFREYGADYVITPIVLGREEGQGFHSLVEMRDRIVELIGRDE